MAPFTLCLHLRGTGTDWKGRDRGILSKTDKLRLDHVSRGAVHRKQSHCQPDLLTLSLYFLDLFSVLSFIPCHPLAVVPSIDFKGGTHEDKATCTAVGQNKWTMYHTTAGWE